MLFKLTAFLIKESYTNFDSLFKENVVKETYDLNKEYQIEGKIFTGINTRSRPDWLELLREGAANSIPDFTNSSSRAVLLIRNNGRIFAFTFGFGRYMLKDEVIIRDFGIRVVLNSVNPNKLRSVDTATIDEITIHSRTQTSRNSGMTAFSIDIVRDLLKAVTGEPLNEDFGSVITGRDSVQFIYELEFQNFITICDYLYEKYTSIDYKKDFEWFDNLQMVRDKSLLVTLNNNLIDIINRRDINLFHMAPPEIIDWNNIGGFSFTEHGPTYNDISLTHYYTYLGNRQINLNGLKRQCIYVKNIDRTQVITRWSVYDSIVFETRSNDDLYILTVGDWFKVESTFAQQVTSYIESIPDAEISLPLCKADEKEEDYNNRVASENSNIISLDRKLVKIDGSSIEICDLLTLNGCFIHVKFWNSSSTLSHLFAQGRVSAMCLLHDTSFRKQVRKRIQKINPKFIDLVDEDAIDPSQIKIVYAIIDSDARCLEERLPFFSKLNMMQTVKLLRNMRFEVYKYKIAYEGKKRKKRLQRGRNR